MDQNPAGPHGAHPSRPVEGTVVPTGPVGFAGAAPVVTSAPGGPTWPQGYWAATAVGPVGVAPVRRRRRRPFALAGAGLLLLVGGGAGGYAVGHANAAGTATTQTGRFDPGTAGQFPGSADGSSGRFGAPPDLDGDLSGDLGGQLDQQGGTTDGTSDGTTT